MFTNTSINRTIPRGGGGGGSINTDSPSYCIDSEGNSTLEGQSQISGIVAIIINGCQGEISENCLYSIASTDFCLTNSTLAEQTCENTDLKIEDIECANGCLNGACLA